MQLLQQLPLAVRQVAGFRLAENLLDQIVTALAGLLNAAAVDRQPDGGNNPQKKASQCQLERSLIPDFFIGQIGVLLQGQPHIFCQRHGAPQCAALKQHAGVAHDAAAAFFRTLPKIFAIIARRAQKSVVSMPLHTQSLARKSNRKTGKFLLK